MNIAPGAVRLLESAGFEAIHWAQVGDPRATDRVLFDWARQRGHVVVRHDLDFPALLAATGVRYPSVVLLRQPELPATRSQLLPENLRRF
jgi:predicted nuclease of predicted toxin-antitoxin system